MRKYLVPEVLGGVTRWVRVSPHPHPVFFSLRLSLLGMQSERSRKRDSGPKASLS